MARTLPETRSLRAGSENCGLLGQARHGRNGAGAAQECCPYAPIVGSRVPRALRPSGEVQPRRSAPAAALTDITNIAGRGVGLGKQSAELAKAAVAPPAIALVIPPKPSTFQFGECQSQATGSTCGSVSSHYNPSSELDDDALMVHDDPQTVAEYAHDIYVNLGRDEGNHLPRPDYMDSQTDINAKMRAILIDWLVEVHLKYKLKTETLFLAVNLIDRFLDTQPVMRRRLQLCGVTAMLIAAKFEEIYPPEVRDFVYITNNAYSKDEILRMEVTMLTKLKFMVCCPTVAHFLERYQRVNNCTEEHRHLMQYVLELTLPEIKMIKYPPSHLAAAAALLSNKLLKQHPSWPASMVLHTQQTEPMVKACARELCGLLEAAGRSPLQAVRRKYSSPKLSRVAKQTF